MNKLNKLSIDTSRIINPYPACVKDFLQLLPNETMQDNDGMIYRLIMPDDTMLWALIVSYNGTRIYDTYINDWRNIYCTDKGHEGYNWVVVPVVPSDAWHKRHPNDDSLDTSHHELVHRLVARAFCPNVNGYNIVHHIDFDKQNNSCHNLIYVRDQPTHNLLHCLIHAGDYDTYNKMLARCLQENLTA